MPSPSLSRRQFLSSTGRQALVAGAAVAATRLIGCADPQRVAAGTGAAVPAEPPKPAAVERLTLPETLAGSERKQADPPAPLPPGGRVGYAVVGLGRLSLCEILPALAQSTRSRLAAVVSGDRHKALAVAGQHGLTEDCVYSYETFDRIAENPAIHAVYVVLPNALHAEYTIRAAQAGKHVLCEKPMATNAIDCQRMIDACAQARRKLMVAYRLQYEPCNREMIRLVRSGELGTLRFITADNGQNLGDPHQWRLDKHLAGGGALPDVGIYCLNAARYLTGREPIAVAARSFSPAFDERFREVEASMAFQLEFPDGILASCTTGYANHERRFLSVLGSDGWARLDQAFTYRGLRLATARANGGREEVCERSLGEKNHFALELDHLSRCIQEDVQPHTGGEEGLQDLRIIEALYASAAQGGRRLELPVVNGIDATRGPKPKEPEA
jgi:predicted dehydrogenase